MGIKSNIQWFALIPILLFYSLTTFAQISDDHPQDYFRAPLKIPLRLSGSFGELRGNHFHSGVDFKTKGKTGVPLYAAEKGHVSRIKVSSGGFGKALYIRHPNGFTTVYAHIGEFNTEISDFVKKVQYERKTYELNLYPNAQKFKLEKGDLIAYSGNSGSSNAPHLHFEIRESKTEKPVNPLFFGFDVKDTRYPIIRGIRLYPKGPNSVIKVRKNHHKEGEIISTGEAVSLDVGSNGNAFYLKDVASLKAKGKVGIGVEVYDYHDGSNNPLGVYQYQLNNNGELLFRSVIEKFPFRKTRYINAHIDYETMKKRQAKYQRCFLLPGNPLPFYRTQNNGLIEVNETNSQPIKLKVEDVFGNVSHLNFSLGKIGHLKALEGEKTADKPENEHMVFPNNQPNKIRKNGIRLNFPAGAFYDTVYFTLSKQSEKSKKAFSPVYQVHDRYTPVQEYYSMAIKASEVPKKHRDKALIAYREKDGKLNSVGGSYQNGFIKTKTRKLGPFQVSIDTISPKIKTVNFAKGKTFNKEGQLKVIIKDELAGIDKYKPRVDGKWVRMAYDAKNDLLTFEDFDRLSKGKHSLKILATDKKGNDSILTTKFKIN